MNKKQLTLQNSSLFAELERKAKEIEILEIRLEEAEERLNTLTAENESLKNDLEQKDNENKELLEKINELENALAEATTKATENNEVFIAEEIELKSENIPEAPQFEETELQEVAEQVVNTEEIEPTYPTTEPKIENFPTEDIVTETLTPPTTIQKEAKRSDFDTDLLRDYGAKIIGKVTRVTAEVLSKVSALNTDATESLKTLALGKNESFKYQIIELAKAKGDPQKIMAEMDFLADEAITYLRSI